MSFTLVNNSGSGSIKDNAVASYSYSEDVTSLEPSNLNGGTGQITVSALSVDENTVGSTHPNSLLLVNNTMSFTDNIRGKVEFQAKKVSRTDGVVSITGDTLMSRLNVIKTAGPHGGGGASLLSAIQYYCGLVGVTPTIDSGFADELDAVSVNFIGWTGNVWEYLKMLCAGVSASETSNVGIEMYVNENTLVFRRAKFSYAELAGTLSSETISVDTFDAAQSIEVFNYNTSYGVNRVVQEQTRSNNSPYIAKDVSITDSMTVEAGTTVTKRFKINATLELVKQPECVDAIFPLPYAGSTGQYVIVGDNDLPITPAEWVGQGGDLRVSLTENPDEIEISVTAPPSVQMPVSGSPTEVTNAPYKIGVESSGEADYPALYIVGTGVFFDKTSKVFLTGASDSYTSKTSAASIDNPFITNDFNQITRGIAAAQVACGPNISLAQESAAPLAFGLTPGKMQFNSTNKFRITNASYGPDRTSLTSTGCAEIADFNGNWAGMTFANFTSVAFNGSNPEALKFNEFTVIPLIKA